MSAQPVRPAVVSRPYDRAADSELVEMLRAGDGAAFDALARRHAPALTRYAGRILRARPAVVEDVVQEALLRSHLALRRDDRHIQVKPYMFRLVRNCCLDELARAHTDAVPLELLQATGDEPAAPSASPHDLTIERETTLSTLAAISALPASQRHALVRRELDGLTHDEVARELGISAAASKNLVHRARENLTRAAEARETRCEDIRHDLLVAHDRRRRPPMTALRHVASCRDCRRFRVALKQRRRQLRVLVPAPAALLLLGGGLGATGKLGGLVGGAGQPLAAKATAVVAAGALAAGGAYALHTHVFGPGSRTPVALQGVGVPGGRLAKGATVPAHMAVVTREAVARRTARPLAVSLTCPATMRVAGLVPFPGDDISHGMDPATVVGVSRRASVLLDTARMATGERRLTVAVLCRVPDRGGSVRAAPRGAGPLPVVHACRRRATLRAVPGASAAGTVTSGQPLAVLAARRQWLRVRTDGGTRGWLPARVAC
ncbi:RNA polymerase sigma factor [Baekduia alba]|uniref:sigma-70 family RNA polymerase sigma factor n=1 Tax=Baekduia alba TaxID=2997333 RepID=UPI0023423172|nr:sigma-70 family RNA polymerase sigma factor [Baekduia alba]WCB95138.1 RNA polymerase sigma factor [Baekduia alba]